MKLLPKKNGDTSFGVQKAITSIMGTAVSWISHVSIPVGITTARMSQQGDPVLNLIDTHLHSSFFAGIISLQTSDILIGQLELIMFGVCSADKMLF